MSMPAAIPKQRPQAASPETEAQAACPWCAVPLAATPERWLFKEIFSWWQQSGIAFSSQAREGCREDVEVVLHRCARCGWGRFQPAQAGNPYFYEELSRQAPQWYYLQDKWEYRQALSDLQGAAKVLEVGCGAGWFLERLKGGKRQLTGLEWNTAAVLAGKSRGLDIRQADLKDLAEEVCGYDAICAFQVLEHVADPKSFIGRAIRLLNSGGCIVLAMPNAQGLLRHVARNPHDVPPHHVTRWTPASCRQMAEAAGLKVRLIKEEPLNRLHFSALPFAWSAGVQRAGNRLPEGLRNFLARFAYLSGAAFTRALAFLRVPCLPGLRGHSLYVVLEKAS